MIWGGELLEGIGGGGGGVTVKYITRAIKGGKKPNPF